MAKIHGISGSTLYLLHGLNTINGQKLTRLEEINRFYNNYERLLADKKTVLERQHDENVKNLSNEEIQQLIRVEKDISKATIDVEGNIRNIKYKRDNSGNIFTRPIFSLKYWWAIRTKSQRIRNSSSASCKKFLDTERRKKTLIANKQSMIKNGCRDLIQSYSFLTSNQTFLPGAYGEERVIRELSGLPDEYHILNDVNLKFSPPIRWKAKNENIVTSQIDHVVVGPSGLFLIETKNWKPEDIENKIEELNYQISRSGLALWYHLSKYRWTDQEPKIRKILVSIQGYKSKPELDNFIHPLSPNQLCGYITTRGTFLSEHTINNLVATIPWSESK